MVIKRYCLTRLFISFISWKEIYTWHIYFVQNRYVHDARWKLGEGNPGKKHGPVARDLRSPEEGHIYDSGPLSSSLYQETCLLLGKSHGWEQLVCTRVSLSGWAQGSTKTCASNPHWPGKTDQPRYVGSVQYSVDAAAKPAPSPDLIHLPPYPIATHSADSTLFSLSLPPSYM